MNQHQAPVGTVATLGHPANRILIVKGNDCWRYVDSGRGVDTEDFRAGWDFYEPERVEIVPGKPYVDAEGQLYIGRDRGCIVRTDDAGDQHWYADDERGDFDPLPHGLRPAKVVPES